MNEDSVTEKCIEIIVKKVNEEAIKRLKILEKRNEELEEQIKELQKKISNNG